MAKNECEAKRAPPLQDFLQSLTTEWKVDSIQSSSDPAILHSDRISIGTNNTYRMNLIPGKRSHVRRTRRKSFSSPRRKLEGPKQTSNSTTNQNQPPLLMMDLNFLNKALNTPVGLPHKELINDDGSESSESSVSLTIDSEEESESYCEKVSPLMKDNNDLIMILPSIPRASDSSLMPRNKLFVSSTSSLPPLSTLRNTSTSRWESIPRNLQHHQNKLPTPPLHRHEDDTLTTAASSSSLAAALGKSLRFRQDGPALSQSASSFF